MTEIETFIPLPGNKEDNWPSFNRYRVSYLVYLLIYPIPWLIHGAPTLPAALFSAGATGIFLLLYFAPYRNDRYYGLPEIIFTALIGFATAWTQGDWLVFNIYATAMCACFRQMRQAVLTIVCLQIALFAFVWLQDKSMLHASIGAFFSIITYIGTWMQWKLGLQNLQLRKAQHEIRTLAATAERERIARDVHDLLGHSLTVISVKAELANRLFETHPDRAQRELQDITQIARTSLKEVREAVTGMNGASLQHELERARKALEAASISLTIHHAERLEDHPQSSVLAMALREAVTNVIRHSGARHCTISFDCDAGGQPCAIRIEDDGAEQSGRSPAPPQEGNGLRGMRTRLAAAGGSLMLSHTSSGLRLTASITP
ncbi:sensor histidine kinase [Gluconobacter cerinus]|uniref:sensor histidine kinase n=1 Tax=Gluconobacter cerinus TaxID=38307 RepID=UPI001B8C14A6|nr:sensor histidine kinase [Gluconobacter cerinus]MBS1018600.1 sensor histidine kinase [Gluconobacter cerinus]